MWAVFRAVKLLRLVVEGQFQETHCWLLSPKARCSSVRVANVPERFSTLEMARILMESEVTHRWKLTRIMTPEYL